MFKLLPILLHATSAYLFAAGFNKLSTLPISSWIDSQKGGHFQFLTMHGFVVVWLTMLVGLMSDFLPSLSALRKVKRTLLMISLPFSVVVSLIYWTLIALFPFLILQPDQPIFVASSVSPITIAQFRLPLDVDLCFHVAPAFASLADFFLLERKYSANEMKYGAPALVLLVTAEYVWYVEDCARHNGFFPYPFLTDNPFPIRVLIYLGSALLALTVFRFINGLQSDNLKSQSEN